MGQPDQAEQPVSRCLHPDVGPVVDTKQHTMLRPLSLEQVSQVLHEHHDRSHFGDPERLIQIFEQCMQLGGQIGRFPLPHEAFRAPECSQSRLEATKIIRGCGDHRLDPIIGRLVTIGQVQ